MNDDQGSEENQHFWDFQDSSPRKNKTHSVSFQSNFHSLLLAT